MGRHQLVVIWRCFRPWGVFDVCCEDMKGVQKGLDWVLDHVGRKNRELHLSDNNVVK